MQDPLLLLHFIANFIMLGLILTIQLVHYPSFRFIDASEFQEFENFHSKSITWIVFPTMLCELVTAFFLFSFYELKGLLLVLTGLIWLSTVFFSIPCHQKLATGKNLKVIDRLVFTNWPRTILWLIKSGLLLFIILR